MFVSIFVFEVCPWWVPRSAWFACVWGSLRGHHPRPFVCGCVQRDLDQRYSCTGRHETTNKNWHPQMWVLGTGLEIVGFLFMIKHLSDHAISIFRRSRSRSQKVLKGYYSKWLDKLIIDTEPFAMSTLCFPDEGGLFNCLFDLMGCSPHPVSVTQLMPMSPPVSTMVQRMSNYARVRNVSSSARRTVPLIQRPWALAPTLVSWRRRRTA